VLRSSSLKPSVCSLLHRCWPVAAGYRASGFVLSTDTDSIAAVARISGPCQERMHAVHQILYTGCTTTIRLAIV
jgi:hypothetical protein